MVEIWLLTEEEMKTYNLSWASALNYRKPDLILSIPDYVRITGRFSVHLEQKQWYDASFGIGRDLAEYVIMQELHKEAMRD